MLAPANRLTLLDALRPPADHVFDAATAVTFTLDLRAMLAAPAAFALASTSEPEGDDAPEPIELLHAIKSHADRITVFAQAGQIALPPSRRVFAFLEKSVVSVTAPHGGIVHPKVWLVRYLDESGAPRHRVLIASRNLTFDGSWDTILRLDEAGRAGTALPELRTLFEGMLERSVGAVDDEHRSRVLDLARSVEDIRFALPSGVDNLRLHVMGLDSDQPSPLPKESDRSMIISPFLSSDFFGGPLSTGPDILVSRQESLDELAPKDLDGVGSVFVFDDGSTPEVTAESWAEGDPAQPMRGMHAKVFAFESGSTATLFAGSANASGRAFGRNVEVLAEMRGPLSALGIDVLCGNDDDSGDEIGLRRLFNTYVRSEDPAPTSEPGKALESARLQLGAIPITGEVSGDGAAWAVTYRSTRPVKLPDGVRAVCWPLTVSGHRRDLVVGEPINERFDLSLAAITGFLAVELSAEDELSQFVIPVDLVGLPEQRNRELLRLMIGNAERFLRYLLALLADDPAELDFLDRIEEVTTEGEAGGTRNNGSGLPVLEAMLKSLRSDPRRLLSVDPLVRDLAETSGGLPEGFVSTWDAVIASARDALT